MVINHLVLSGGGVVGLVQYGILKQLTKLKIYSGNNHPHEAQNPKIIELNKLNDKKIIISANAFNLIII